MPLLDFKKKKTSEMLTKNIIGHGKPETKNIPFPSKQSLVLVTSEELSQNLTREPCLVSN